MKTCRSTSRTMRLLILVSHLGLILRTDAQIPDACVIKNSDITVVCGTKYMDLSIYLCPMYQALYNESLMVLNNQENKPHCYGTADWSVTPPVLRYRLPINESSLSECSNGFQITNQIGSGEFSDFSNIQFVNISGTVTSVDPSVGMITYRQQIFYKFSCKYPMQYLVNNTQLGVSGVSLAIKDNNGSFVSTLSMQLYKDKQYTDILTVPETGLNLKTKIYVGVKATNLTERFNVLLDRCYATTTPYPTQKYSYDLFVGCTRDAQTKVEVNGESQMAHFSFEAFRFVEHKNLTVSTFYLHCVTRLCEVSTCEALRPNCDGRSNRRRREVSEEPANATITSPAIFVARQKTDEAQTFSAPLGSSPESNYSSPVVAIIICIVIIAIFIAILTVFFGLFIKRRKPIIA